MTTEFDMKSEKFMTTTKPVLSRWLEKASKIICQQRDMIEKSKQTMEQMKTDALTDKTTVIKLQSDLLESKSDQLQALQTTVQSTVQSVQTTVQAEMKTYSEALQANASSTAPVISPDYLKKVVESTIKEEDRTRNVLVFGLKEEQNENTDERINDLLSVLGDKPKVAARRLGRTGPHSSTSSRPRPVKVSFTNAITVKQILSKTNVLKKSAEFKSVYICPDRSHEEREVRKSLVVDLKKAIKEVGEKHLGAVIGAEEFRQEYMEKKMQGWVNEVIELSGIAEEEPQVAYAAYTKGLSHKWSYIQRTVKDVSEFFSPLEHAIRNVFIPSLIGRQISDIERRLLALPLRYGGMGIANPMITCDREYEASISITESLKNLIINQQNTLDELDYTSISTKKAALKISKAARFSEEYKNILDSLPKLNKRALEQSAMKGSSSWLSALPLKALGYCLNKNEFRDSIHLRYGWPIPDIHSYCACGAKNDVDHVLICKKGGYVTFRHNALRDAEAELLREVCKDVRTEPTLLPTHRDAHPPGSNTADQARLDIVVTGLWGTFERTFWDVRVTHANAPSNSNMTMEKLFDRNENEKKSKYSSRVINTEKCSFVPLVYSTAGAVAPECDKHHKRVAEVMATKRRERYADVLNFIRTKIRFALLKSVLIAVRGVRGKAKVETSTPIYDIPFGLIPTEHSYESPC